VKTTWEVVKGKRISSLFIKQIRKISQQNFGELENRKLTPLEES
jgi:hypothetical protein